MAPLLAAGLLSACQIPAVQYAGTSDPQTGCTSIARRVMIDPPASGGLNDKSDTAFLPAEGFEAAGIERLFAGPASKSLVPAAGAPFLDEPVSNSMLFLSGGSQDGAFGAGFLTAWNKARPGGIPRFRVVTGISTGALQSTFSFIDEPRRAEEKYRIEKESELLNAFTKGGLKSKSKWVQAGGALSLARKGAVAELQPLRESLRSLIDDETLRKVAAQAGPVGSMDERMLLVGAVEMDSGDAFVFDLSEAARRYVAGDAAMRDCYVEALMASSSVPMAALPVFIEGKMYIDGGARFGVISDFLSKTYADAAKGLPDDEPKNLFVLVNGTLETSATCNLKGCDDNPLPPTPPGEVPQHSDWSFDRLALRSMSILINQSYRSSVYLARREGEDMGFAMRFVRMTGHKDHLATLTFDDPAGETLTCGEWAERDKKRDAPLEFHPRFMRCLIDYGATLPALADWVKAE